jgi:hypothetical protein
MPSIGPAANPWPIGSTCHYISPAPQSRPLNPARRELEARVPRGPRGEAGRSGFYISRIPGARCLATPCTVCDQRKFCDASALGSYRGGSLSQASQRESARALVPNRGPRTHECPLHHRAKRHGGLVALFHFGPAKSILVDRRLVKAYASWVFRFRSRGT